MALQLLELRVNQLENLIMGERHKDTCPSDMKHTIFDQLVAVHHALVMAEKRIPIARILARGTEIQKYADPSFLDNDTVSTKAKMEIILSEAEKLKKTARALETIRELADVLNHPSFRELSFLRERLNGLHSHCMDQQRKSSRVISESQDMLRNYYSLISDISKLLIQWNQRVTTESSK